MQNRLARIDKYSGYQTVSESVEYRYNTAGIRIQKTEDPDGTPIVTDYLIDPYNHTGYAQVLQETVDDGSSDWTRIQYTIGDDVLAQTSLTSADSGANWTTGDTQYLLYDGHGSTRQLVSDTGAVQDGYNYDSYGVMLGDSTTPNPAKTAGTSLLYSGEQYDSNLDQYYLRARYYNQNSGTFNRVDPYSGNMQDPQSLHKYAYVHNNPVNGIDPSGLLSLVGSVKAISIGASIGAVIGGVITKSWKGALYGAISGANIVSIAILSYINNGMNFGAYDDAAKDVAITVILGLVAGLLAVLAKDVIGEEGNYVEKHSEAFLRGFALTTTMMLMKQGLKYIISKAQLVDRIVDKVFGKYAEDLIYAFTSAMVEIIWGISTGKIFTEPKKVFMNAGVAAGTSFLVKRFAVHASVARGESETAIRLLSGFIAGRFKTIASDWFGLGI